MAPDPHQGELFEDMAAKGTTIPGDARVQRLVGYGCSERNYGRILSRLHILTLFQTTSVPRPDQKDVAADQARANPAHAADNAFDIPRSVNDRGHTGEILTGTGDQLSSNIEKKYLDDANFDPRAKGRAQYAKHARQDEPLSSLKHGAESHDVEAAPGEEFESQDALLNKRGAQ